MVDASTASASATTTSAAAAATRSIIIHLKEEYDLCRYCLARQAGHHAGKKRVKKCHICRGLFDKLDEFAKKILASTEQYQFDTFLIGATLPTQLFEREDALRARLKIRGRECIKSQLTRELGQRFAKMTGKHVDFARPDVTVHVSIGREGDVIIIDDVQVRARPVTLKGRYTKKIRGMPQKHERCPMCEGKGCNLCNNTGMYGDYGNGGNGDGDDGTNSVEGILAKHLVRATGGRDLKFSWIGSEDRDSLVTGSGRPFYVKVSDPKARKPVRWRFSEAGVRATITDVLDDTPDTQVPFMVKTKIVCSCERSVTRTDITKLNLLAGREARFAGRSKVNTKRIHSARARKTGDSEFVLTVKADGGLPIKQFVGGQEYMEPNISALLEAKCECVTFDILDVQ